MELPRDRSAPRGWVDIIGGGAGGIDGAGR